MALAGRHDVPPDAMAQFMRLGDGDGPRCTTFMHTRAYAHDLTTAQMCAS
jgi:hypothetical protein